MPVRSQAFFLPVNGGQRFCLFHPAANATPARGLVLYVHPFAEEMNKTRRMAALQSRALAQAGYDVLQPDLLGCGDSSGDFGDASWDGWVSDVVQGCRWLRSRASASAVTPAAAPLWLWGLRAGCLLAAQAAAQLNEPCNFLFWQPSSAGKPLLQQFLRLKVMGGMLGGESKGLMQALREQLASGSAVEIAGYSLASKLALGLEQSTLAPPPNAAMGQRLEWFEVSSREDATLNPMSTQTIGQWQQAGFRVSSHVAQGPAFWQTTEIEEAPDLIAVTTAALMAARP